MIKKQIYNGLLILSLSLAGFSCSNDITEPDLETNDVETRASSDNSFDLDNIVDSKIPMKNLNGNVVQIRVPWDLEGSNDGVPIEWIDLNIKQDKSKRMYTRAKGWELIYSNVNEADAYKYIGLYNKYQGVLRFFVYIFSSTVNQGSSDSFWGLSINKSSSLLNFNSEYAEAQDQKNSILSVVTSSIGTFQNSKFQTLGLQNAKWYAFEVECAYDPLIKANTGYIFTLMGRAVNKGTTVGNIGTNGTITGSIKSTASQNNLTFTNMFNKTNSSSITINQEGVADVAGTTIDNGITQKDSFFTGLWNNIKDNASSWITSGLQSGAKKGIETILSSGGSVVANSLSGLFKGLIGSSNKENISKVDLDVKLKSTVELVNESTLIGFGDKRLQVAGTYSGDPIYDKPLGVWNLTKTPNIKIKSYTCNYYPTRKSSYIVGVKFYYEYSIENKLISLNPEIQKEFSITDEEYIILTTSGGAAPFDLPATFTLKNNIVEEKLYAGNYSTAGYNLQTSIFKNTSNYQGYLYHPMAKLPFKVKVSFTLVNKTNGEKYFHSKVFNATSSITNYNVYKTYLDEMYSQHPIFGGLY